MTGIGSRPQHSAVLAGAAPSCAVTEKKRAHENAAAEAPELGRVGARLNVAHVAAKAREILHGGRTEDAFSKFDILERRADFAEGRAEALGLTGPKALEEEIAELKASEAVDAELAQMKAALAAARN